MPKPITALDSTHLLSENWRRGQRSQVQAGHWLRQLTGRITAENPLYPSWTWQAVAGEAGQLLLRADGIAEQLVLTQDIADQLVLFTPSTRIDIANYLEVLSWWRACQWGVHLVDLQQGRVMLLADQYGSQRNNHASACMSAEVVTEPELVWLTLLECLYSLVHPRKRLGSGQELSEEERTAFIKEMRHKVAKVTVS